LYLLFQALTLNIPAQHVKMALLIKHFFYELFAINYALKKNASLLMCTIMMNTQFADSEKNDINIKFQYVTNKIIIKKAGVNIAIKTCQWLCVDC